MSKRLLHLLHNAENLDFQGSAPTTVEGQFSLLKSENKKISTLLIAKLNAKMSGNFLSIKGIQSRASKKRPTTVKISYKKYFYDLQKIYLWLFQYFVIFLTIYCVLLINLSITLLGKGLNFVICA